MTEDADKDIVKAFLDDLASAASADDNIKESDVSFDESLIDGLVAKKLSELKTRRLHRKRLTLEEVDAAVAAGPQPTGKVKSIKLIGKHPTLDICVAHPDHQFYLSNGMLTSNSHATGYAMISYQCAYLMTYFEPEWLCSYLESMSNNEDKRAKAFSEVRSLGYKIVPIDINQAALGWTIIEGKKFMPSFTTCKHVGAAAVAEIMQSRPYASFEDVLWDEEGNWRPSKLNRAALEALVSIGAFDSLDCVGEDKLFESYAHMYEVLFGTHTELVIKKKRGQPDVEEEKTIDHFTSIKRSTKAEPHAGRKNFYELIKLTRGSVEPWSRRDKALKSIEYFGSLDVNNLVDPKVMEVFDQKQLLSIDDFDEEGVYWFCVVKVEKKTTKANGKRYLLLTAQGPAGKSYRIYAWGWDGHRVIEPYSVCFAHINKSDFGFGTSMFKLRELE